MKYGETIFDIAYLLFAIISGIIILRKENDDTELAMGRAVLFLGLGDAFHLVPRVLSYFSRRDLTALLGIGKLVTSITMTIFYVLMFKIYMALLSKKRRNNKLTMTINILAIIRIILLLLPQNNWLNNESPLYMSVIRNIPFIILGFLVTYLYFRERKVNKELKDIWILMLLSFLFYIPVVLLASTFSIVRNVNDTKNHLLCINYSYF